MSHLARFNGGDDRPLRVSATLGVTTLTLGGTRNPVRLGGAAMPSLLGMRVLVVDDDADTLDLLAATLGPLHAGATVMTARSVLEALEYFDRMAPWSGSWPAPPVSGPSGPSRQVLASVSRDDQKSVPALTSRRAQAASRGSAKPPPARAR